MENTYTKEVGTVIGYKIYEDQSLLYVVEMDNGITAYCTPMVIKSLES